MRRSLSRWGEGRARCPPATGATSREVPTPADQFREIRGTRTPPGIGGVFCFLEGWAVRVRVRVPATIANFGPAFDVLGLALSLHNEVELEPSDRPEVTVSGEGEHVLPATAANLVARAAERVAQAAGRAGVFRIRCRNRIPLGRGLGSSAAGTAGGG